MKKQFFYAAMALAMMSSCTNEIVPIEPEDINPGIENEDDRFAIELGVDAPGVIASTRGYGSVGDVADGETGSKKNVWNSQRLYIHMIDKADGLEAHEIGVEKDIIFDNSKLEFRAPKKTTSGTNVTGEQSGTIRIYDATDSNNKYSETNDEGTLKYKYYPVSGQYDFIGYHIDDAAGYTDVSETTLSSPTVDLVTTPHVAKITKLTIDGTQDLLAANTVGFTTKEEMKKYTGNESPTSPEPSATGTATWTEWMNKWAFSARTARQTYKPILQFKHQLAQLKFYVRAGSAKTAAWEYTAGSTPTWTERKQQVNGQGEQVSEGMQITRIAVLNMINALEMTINQSDPTKTATTSATGATANNTFYVHNWNTEKTKLVTAEESTITDVPYANDKKGFLTTPGIPAYPANATNLPQANGTPALAAGTVVDKDNKVATVVGEPMMFFPYAADGTALSKLDVDLKLKQLVLDEKDETASTGSGEIYNYLYQNAKISVKAPSNTENIFKPGFSYNVYITIYGFERIEVTAELDAWKVGGDVETDVENDARVEISFDVPAVNLTATTGSTSNLVVTAEEEANCTIPEDDKAWLSVEKVTAPAQTRAAVTTTFKFTAQENTSAERSSTVTIKAGSYTKDITITQAGAGEGTTEPQVTLVLVEEGHVTSINATDETYTCKVKASGLDANDITATITGGESSWLKFTNTQATDNTEGEYTLNFTCTANNGTEASSRTETFTISGGGITLNAITVTQAAAGNEENGDAR